MTQASFRPAVGPSRSAAAELSAALRAAARPLMAHVRETVTAGAARGHRDVEGMNARMPRAMGAEGTRLAEGSRPRAAALRSLPLLLALALVNAATPSLAQPPCAPAQAPASSAATRVAEFTGQFEGGTPVYRLPGLTVTASRNVAVVEAQAKKRDAPAAPARRQPS